MPGIKGTMEEFGKGALKSSAGTKVKNPKQAVAIGLSEERRGMGPNSGPKLRKPAARGPKAPF